MNEVETKKPIVNIADAPVNDVGNGKQFVAKVGRVGRLLGPLGRMTPADYFDGEDA